MIFNPRGNYSNGQIQEKSTHRYNPGCEQPGFQLDSHTLNSNIVTPQLDFSIVGFRTNL